MDAEIMVAGGATGERVAVHPDDVLGIDGDRLPAMDQFAETAVRHHLAHVEIGLGAGKVVDAHGYRRMAMGRASEWRRAASAAKGL